MSWWNNSHAWSDEEEDTGHGVNISLNDNKFHSDWSDDDWEKGEKFWRVAALDPKNPIITLDPKNPNIAILFSGRYFLKHPGVWNYDRLCDCKYKHQVARCKMEGCDCCECTCVLVKNVY